MTRRILGLCIGGAGLFALFLGTAAGCGSTGSIPVAQDAANLAASAASVPAAAAGAVVNATTAGATSSSPANQRPAWTRPHKVYGLKRNGRGGYDVSKQQQHALKMSRLIAKHYGTINRTPRKPPTSQPTTRPSSPSAPSAPSAPGN